MSQENQLRLTAILTSISPPPWIIRTSNQITFPNMLINCLVQGLVLAILLQMIQAYHSTNRNFIRNPLTHGRNTVGCGKKRADAIAKLYEFYSCKENDRQKLLEASSWGSRESSIEEKGEQILADATSHGTVESSVVTSNDA